MVRRGHYSSDKEYGQVPWGNTWTLGENRPRTRKIGDRCEYTLGMGGAWKTLNSDGCECFVSPRQIYGKSNICVWKFRRQLAYAHHRVSMKNMLNIVILCRLLQKSNKLKMVKPTHQVSQFLFTLTCLTFAVTCERTTLLFSFCLYHAW